MTDLLLAEELFLIAHGASGKESYVEALVTGYAGALLLDLADQDLLTVSDDKRLTASPGTPTHPLLAAAYGELVASDKRHRSDYWLNRLTTRLRPLDTRLGQSLVARGVLAEQHDKVLGLFGRTIWPERDPEPERRLRAQLVSVLVQQVPPTHRQAMLIALLSALGAESIAVDRSDRRAANRRAKQIAKSTVEGDAVGQAISHAVHATQSAVITAIVASTVTTTVTGS